MVKKLLKHEFIYYGRSFGLFLPIVLVIGLMTRVFRFFDNGNILTGIAAGSSILLLVVACFTLIMMSSIIGIVRFYKNLYTAEGYLTFTLPVTNAQHIFVKLLVSLACQAICLVTVLAAASIAMAGETFLQVVGSLGAAIRMLGDQCGAGNLVGYVIEFGILLLLSVISNMLLYYACITVGQTAKKNRILMAVVAYFVYYVITQVISTVFSMVFMVLGMSGAMDSLTGWLTANFIPALHVILLVMILFCAAVSGLFWFITQTIMTKKLNLE
jgi:hypothetical protein